MRRSFSVGLLAICLLCIPQAAFGLMTADVQAQGGETTLMFIGDKGLQLATEYGISSQLGFSVAIRNDSTRVGAKYEIDSSLALLLGTINNAPYLGANISMPIDEYMGVIGDLSLSLASNRLTALFELGMVFDLADNLDLRGGLLAETDQDSKNFSFQMGLGVSY